MRWSRTRGNRLDALVLAFKFLVILQYRWIQCNDSQLQFMSFHYSIGRVDRAQPSFIVREGNGGVVPSARLVSDL